MTTSNTFATLVISDTVNNNLFSVAINTMKIYTSLGDIYSLMGDFIQYLGKPNPQIEWEVIGDNDSILHYNKNTGESFIIHLDCLEDVLIQIIGVYCNSHPGVSIRNFDFILVNEHCEATKLSIKQDDIVALETYKVSNPDEAIKVVQENCDDGMESLIILDLSTTSQDDAEGGVNTLLDDLKKAMYDCGIKFENRLLVYYANYTELYDIN